MPRLSARTVVWLVVGLVVVELVAHLRFGMTVPGRVAAGLLALAGGYVVVVAMGLLVHAHGGLAWPFSYEPSLATSRHRARGEAQFANLRGRVDSYLSNTSRPDEVHPVIVEIVRDRLATRHGVDLEDRAAATPLLGKALASYVYNPPARTLRGRSHQRLAGVLSRIEEL